MKGSWFTLGWVFLPPCHLLSLHLFPPGPPPKKTLPRLSWTAAPRCERYLPPGEWEWILAPGWLTQEQKGVKLLNHHRRRRHSFGPFLFFFCFFFLSGWAAEATGGRFFSEDTCHALLVSSPPLPPPPPPAPAPLEGTQVLPIVCHCFKVPERERMEDVSAEVMLVTFPRLTSASNLLLPRLSLSHPRFIIIFFFTPALPSSNPSSLLSDMPCCIIQGGEQPLIRQKGRDQTFPKRSWILKGKKGKDTPLAVCFQFVLTSLLSQNVLNDLWYAAQQASQSKYHLYQFKASRNINKES